MPKEIKEVVEDETQEEIIEPVSEPEDNQPVLQLADIENKLNDLAGKFEEREALAKEALADEVETEAEEPEKKTGIFKKLLIASSVVGFAVVLYHALKPKEAPVSQAVEVEA